MAFWDDIINGLDFRPRRRVSGSPIPPGGPFPGGPAGSSQIGSNAFDRITDLIDRSNRGRYGGISSGEFSGGINSSRLPWRSAGGRIGAGLSSAFQPPGIEDILRRLEELQNPDRYMDASNLEEQAMAAASAQYDPLISALRRQMASAEARGQRNKAELGRMYSALSGSYKEDIPAIQQQYAGDKASTAKLYNDQKAAVKQQYDASQKEQADMMKQLGIEAAASEVLPQQQRDEDYFINLAGQDNTVQQSALNQERAGTVNYTREGAQIARSEGTNRQADLIAELQDLLAEYEGQIGEYGAAKQQAYVAGLGQLRSQMMEDAYNRSDRAAQNYLDMINLGRALRRDEAEMGAGQEIGPVKSPADIAGRVLGMGLNQAQARGIQDVMSSMLANDPTILSGRDKYFGQTVPKEALAARIVEEGRKRGFSRQALNALQTIALEYFGRR